MDVFPNLMLFSNVISTRIQNQVVTIDTQVVDFSAIAKRYEAHITIPEDVLVQTHTLLALQVSTLTEKAQFHKHEHENGEYGASL